MLPRERALEALLELHNRRGLRSYASVVDRLLRASVELIECDAAVVSGRRGSLHVLRAGDTEARPHEGRESSFPRSLLRHGVPVVVTNFAEDPRVGEAEACPGFVSGPVMFVPLRARETAGGYLAFHRAPRGARFTSDETAVAMVLAAWAAATLDGARLTSALEKLAVTDDLTQVYNYRFLKTALRREIKRAGRYNQELALVMIDVDNLKTYNDRNGHLRGSHLLKEAAGLIAQQVRSFDLVAKYGGDEFTVILPQTNREGAMVVAERVRASIEEHAFPLTHAGTITISLGVSMFPEDATDSTSLIQVADRALYQAKQRGRNRVETLWPQAA